MGSSTHDTVRRHELKTWPGEFRAILSFRKKHEIRYNDRDFREGDELLLREWDPETKAYSGDQVMVSVTYISKGPEWGLPESMVVMSIKIELWTRGG